MDKREMKRKLKAMIPEMKTIKLRGTNMTYKRVFLGLWMELDPCGREDHEGIPIPKKCWDYWGWLGEAVYELGGWTENKTDRKTGRSKMFFCMPDSDDEKKGN